MDIIAHRGASHDAPENTLASTRLAWAQGADALELDVQLTRDGELAVIHDDDLKRVAGVASRVRNATLAELQRIDVGRWKAARFAGEKIPSLDEVLTTVPAGRRVFIEIKGGTEMVGALERSLSRHGLQPGQVVIISFDQQAAQAAKRAMPAHEACWIVDSPGTKGTGSLEEIVRACAGLGLDGLDFEASWPLDAESVQQIHRHGFKVYTWTVDDASTARRMAAARVDGLTTNRPGWMREKLAPT